MTELDTGKGSTIVIDDKYKELIKENPDLLTPQEEVQEEDKKYYPPSRLA